MVKAAQRALAERNVNLVLIWVLPEGEAEVRATFAHALTVRQLGPEARATA